MTGQAPYFELWENRSGNLLAEFDTEEEALGYVRTAAKDLGMPNVLSWSLHRSDSPASIAYGKALYALAERQTPS